VTGAAGAVGIYVCQLLKKRGCFVVGIAGTDTKCSELKSKFGVDVAINYKSSKITPELLTVAFANKGIDLFWDNVGGETFDAAVTLMNVHGRIAICGQIAEYDHLDTPQLGPRFLHLFIYKRIKLEGILQRDADAQVRAQHQAEYSRWLENGELHSEITIVDGFEKIPEAQVAMMRGENIGKMLVQCANCEISIFS